MDHQGFWTHIAAVLSPVLSTLVEKTRAALQQEAEGRSFEPVDVEREVQSLLEHAAPIVVAYLVEQARGGRVRNEHVCPRCGGQLRFVQDAPRTIGFIFGEVRIKRARYHCDHCHKGRTPLEQVWGLQTGPRAMGKRRLTPRAQCQVVALAAAGAYSKARDHLRRFTPLRVCTMTVWRYVQRFGRWMREKGEEAVAAIPLAPGAEPGKTRRPLRWIVGADGINVRVVLNNERRKRKAESEPPEFSTGGTVLREVKVGVVALLNKAGQVVGESQWYMAMLEKAAQFRRRLRETAVARGMRVIDEVAIASDAANWLPALGTRHFTEATMIRDFYHAREHLGRMGEALYGKGSKEAAEWASQMGHRLREEGARPLVSEWEKMDAQPKDRETWQRELAYFQSNQDAMDYPSLRARNLPIGSGSAEGGCKYVVGDRFKLAGMRWSEEGLRNLLPIRTAYCNGVFSSA